MTGLYWDGFAAVIQLPQPTTEGAIWAGIVILFLLISLAVITLIESVYQRRRDVRRERAQPDIETALLSRMSVDDPEWDKWSAGLSQAERTAARELLDEYLRTVVGREKANLIQLAHSLGIIEEAHEMLDHRARHKRLQALGWLTLTEQTVPPNRLSRTCTDDNDLRAAAARVLFVADHPDAKSAGTDFLLGDGTPRAST